MDELIANNSVSLAGSKIYFPWKLHYLLDEVEKKGQSSIVSWLPNGQGFKVHSKEKFVNFVMPVYFNTNRYKSFQRNLNLWGFERVRKGVFKGACYHPCFIRGQPNLCQHISRQKPFQSQVEKRRSLPLAQELHASEATLPSALSSSMPSSMPSTGAFNDAAFPRNNEELQARTCDLTAGNTFASLSQNPGILNSRQANASDLIDTLLQTVPVNPVGAQVNPALLNTPDLLLLSALLPGNSGLLQQM